MHVSIQLSFCASDALLCTATATHHSPEMLCNRLVAMICWMVSNVRIAGATENGSTSLTELEFWASDFLFYLANMCEKIRERVQYKPAITHSSRRLSRVCGSQDHIITGQVKRPQEVSSWLYCSDHVAQGVLKTSKDGDHTASVGNLPACTHGEKKRFSF